MTDSVKVLLSMEEIGREISKLPGAANLSSLSVGTRLYIPGDPSDHVYLLHSGCVKLYRLGPGGKHCIFGVVKNRQFFGEDTLLGETKRRAVAEVLEKSSVTMISRDAVLEYAVQNPGFWRAFALFLGQKVSLLEEQLQWLYFLDVEQRLVQLLLKWAGTEHPAQENRLEPQIRLSQKELAGLVGATRETTSGALNRLQRAGCIEIGRRRLMIRSIEKLTEYAKNGTLVEMQTVSTPVDFETGKHT